MRVLRKFLICMALIFLSNRGSAQSWHALSPGIDSLAYALLADEGDSMLYITSEFDQHHILTNLPGAIAWNGEKYIQLKGYLNSALSGAVIEYNKSIYFGSPSSGYIIILSRWNGQEWRLVPDTSNAVSGPYVGTISNYNNELYVFGNFAIYGDLKSMAKYDGTQWSLIGNSMKFNGFPNASIVFNNKLFVGGGYMAFDTLIVPNIATWNDSIFVDKSIPRNFCTISRFEIHLDTLYCSTLCGEIYKYVDADWKLFLTADSAVTTLESYEDKLFIGGYFGSIESTSANHIAYYYENNLFAMAEGTNGVVYDIEAFKNNIYVAGKFSMAGGNPANNIARWGSPVGIEEKEGATGIAIEVYPNPSSNSVKLKMNVKAVNGQFKLEVIDLEGQVVFSKSNFKSETLDLDVSGLSPGMYLIKLIADDFSEIYSTKFVKD